MQDLSTLPPNTEWPITFDAPDGNNYTVQMSTAPSDGGTNVTPVFQVFNSAGLSIQGSAADPASNYTPDGTITIVVPRNLIGNPAVGTQLKNFLVRITISDGLGGGLTPDNMPNSTNPGGTPYTIVGNEFCRPNTAPIAMLSANPVSGAPPLNVTFTPSGTDADAGDTIASYTINFGDGSASVTQNCSTTCPQIQHTYNTGGQFAATLKVTDSRGKVSNNTALVEISVNTPPRAALTASPTSGNAPLNVSFDASGSSDADSGDTIASYAFNFGDGTGTTQSTATVSHQYNIAGTYTASLTVTDSRGAPSSNTATQNITVSGLPDLVVSRLTTNPAQPSHGATVTVTATVNNQGTANAGTSQTEFLLDGKTRIALVSTSALAPGASVQVSANWTNVKKGKHTIKATADRTNAVHESNENNNAKTITVTVN
jgi:PKD repeat protein